MEQFQAFDASLLDHAGLNRQAVFDLDALPADIAAPLRAGSNARFRQLILLGHAGRRLWEAVKTSDVDPEHPIDDFTMRTVRRWFADKHPQHTYDIIYPGSQTIGLQRLGQLAGWHHATPFMVGIDPKWGTWFAYRAVVLADTAFAPTRSVEGEHSCMSCKDKPCITACPANALEGGQFDLARCIGYRRQADSRCRETCVSRLSCPIGIEHRYPEEQIRHSYTLSLRAIEKYY